MKIDLPLIESRKRRVDFDEGYRIEIEKIYLDSDHDVIVVRSEITIFFYNPNLSTHFENYVQRKLEYQKDQEKIILKEIAKLAKGTNRATERYS